MGKYDDAGGKTIKQGGTANDMVTKTPGLDPGRRTRTQDLPPVAVGDQYIDHGAVCTAGGEGCFLSDGQRERLIHDLQLRITEAGGHYVTAAAQVRVDKLMEKDEDLPIIVGLVLDVAGMYFTAKALAALTAMKTSFVSKVNDQLYYTGEVDKAWKLKAVDALHKIQPQQLAGAVGAAITQSKTQISGAMKRIADKPAADGKAESLSYIDQLSSQAQIAYSKLREDIPGTATDAELMAWREAFDPKSHLVAQYKQALEEKLARLEKSGAKKIQSLGTDMVGHGKQFGPPLKGGDDELDSADQEADGIRIPGIAPATIPGFHDPGVFVVWQEYASGYPKELVFRYGGKSEPGNVFAGQSKGPRYGGKAPKSTKDPSAVPFGVPKMDSDVVPPEFHDYAVARHTQVWRSPPGTEMVDDSTWYWAPERARKAAANKANDPFLVPAKTPDELVQASQKRTGLPAPAPSKPVPRLDLTKKPLDIPDSLNLYGTKKDKGDEL